MDMLDLEATVERLSAALPVGGRIAVADGAGFPHEAWPALVDLTARRPDLRLLIGWCIPTPERIDELRAESARTVISGFGLRRAIDAGRVGFLPVRLGAMPALLAGPLRCDALVTTLRPAGRGFAFATEVGWQRAVIATGAAIFAVLRANAPRTASGALLALDRVEVLGESARRPDELAARAPSQEQRDIGARIAALVPDGARLQVGPGGLGSAIFDGLTRPVAVDTGIVSDQVADLDARGLLESAPLAPYVVGTEHVYEWCADRVRVAGVEFTHDPSRLAHGRPLVAVNTGLEIDIAGQVNGEAVGGMAVGGVGGQPDFAAAAAASRGGLSVIAMTTHTTKGVPTLVRSLQMPATTPSHDVDIVVTERGSADLRGLTRSERTAALIKLWGGAPD